MKTFKQCADELDSKYADIILEYRDTSLFKSAEEQAEYDRVFIETMKQYRREYAEICERFAE